MTFRGSITSSPRPHWYRALLAVSLSGLLGPAGCSIAPPRPEPGPPATLRVGTSGDYSPFSTGGDANWNAFDGSPAMPPTGFDPAIASAYAADRGLVIEWVRFRWPDLLADLAADRFDIAMSGVTVRPDRSLVGRFSLAVCRTGAVLLVDRNPARHDSALHRREGDARFADLDRSDVRIAVNAGGHLERATRVHFPNATVIAVPDNGAVLGKVLDGTADAAATDTQEAPVWLSAAPSLELWGPFTRDYKAYLVRPDREELASDLDDWLLAREADGRLAELRSAHLQGKQAALAAELPALVIGIAERLALMPMVAEAKRRSGGPIEVLEREARVIEAGARKTREIARERGVAIPDPSAVGELFRAQIEAAKAIQRAVLAGPPTMQEPPDLTSELRPALIRIGDRLAGLIVGLQTKPGTKPASGDRVRAITRAALAPQGLDEVHVDAIAAAIASLASTRNAPDGADAP